MLMKIVKQKKLQQDPSPLKRRRENSHLLTDTRKGEKSWLFLLTF